MLKNINARTFCLVKIKKVFVRKNSFAKIRFARINSTNGNPPLEFKRNKRKCNLHYAAILVMTSQILKSASFTKTQKSRYLKNDTFFLHIKKFINYTSSAALSQRIVL